MQKKLRPDDRSFSALISGGVHRGGDVSAAAAEAFCGDGGDDAAAERPLPAAEEESRPREPESRPLEPEQLPQEPAEPRPREPE